MHVSHITDDQHSKDSTVADLIPCHLRVHTRRLAACLRYRFLVCFVLRHHRPARFPRQ